MDKKKFIALCKAGDEFALSLLYTGYAPRMKRLCLRYVHDEAAAEDLLHDGFIIILSTIGQLKDASKLESWMATIMRRLALRHLGKTGSEQLVPLDKLDDSTELGADTIQVVSDYKLLLRLIEGLPDGYRSVFKMSVFDGLSHKEIAQLLSINPHSSSSQLARAREMLRVIVTRYGFVPIVAVALLWALRLGTPESAVSRRAPALTATEQPLPAAKEATPTATPLAPSRAPQPVVAVRVAVDATPASPDTATIVPPIAADTTQIAAAAPPDSSSFEPLPPLQAAADFGHSTMLAPQGGNGWVASVSYTDGTEAQSSIFTERKVDTGIDSSTDITETVEEKSHHHMPLVVELSLRKTLQGGRWAIGTGMRYSLLKSDFTTITDYEVTSRTQQVHYVGIPLSVSYRLWRTGRLSLYTSAGMAADIPVSGSSVWQWSVMAGAGVQYEIVPRVSLFAEPGVSYHLNAHHGTPTIWTEHPWGVTVPVGLRFTW